MSRFFFVILAYFFFPGEFLFSNTDLIPASVPEPFLTILKNETDLLENGGAFIHHNSDGTIDLMGLGRCRIKPENSDERLRRIKVAQANALRDIAKKIGGVSVQSLNQTQSTRTRVEENNHISNQWTEETLEQIKIKITADLDRIPLLGSWVDSGKGFFYALYGISASWKSSPAVKTATALPPGFEGMVPAARDLICAAPGLQAADGACLVRGTKGDVYLISVGSVPFRSVSPEKASSERQRVRTISETKARAHARSYISGLRVRASTEVSTLVKSAGKAGGGNEVEDLTRIEKQIILSDSGLIEDLEPVATWRSENAEVFYIALGKLITSGDK